MVLPTEQERERALQSLLEGGYARVESAYGNPSVVDPWGITVSLVVRAEVEPSLESAGL
jgi:hypothetical protein